MAKKKAQKRLTVRFVDTGNGELHKIVAEDGKYYFTATSQFRKCAFRTVEKEIAEDAEGEANGSDV